MLTAEIEAEEVETVVDEDEEDEEYSEEFLRELEAEAEEAIIEYRAGKLKYVPLEELAAEFGVDLNEV
jgi:hypothetical protein